MSNPTRAPLEPVEGIREGVDTSLDAYWEPWLSERGETLTDWDFKVKGAKELESLKRKLGGLDMEVARTIMIRAEETVDKGIRECPKQVRNALAQNDGLTFRVRSGFAARMRTMIVDALVDWADFTVDQVRERCVETFRVAGGTQFAINRLVAHYPSRTMNTSVLMAPSLQEVEESLRRCGLGIPEATLREAQVPLMVNPKSDNGFPVLGKWEDEEAQEKIFILRDSLRVGFEKQYDEGGRNAVYRYMRELERRAPQWVAFRGKCKADPYKPGKVFDFMMRFYNALPRQITLNMQVATQGLENVSLNILDDWRVHTAIGIGLAHGNAERLVEALERQLGEDGAAYVHVGDDSWVMVVFEVNGVRYMLMFSLDCTSFDLTQHSKITKAVHMGLANQLEKVDGPGGAVWYALARERLVVTVTSAVMRWKHGGPSGMPLQSKVNDVLMDLFIRRLLDAMVRKMEGGFSPMEWTSVLDEFIKNIATGMGFKVRLEDCFFEQVEFVRDMLRLHPFKFIGYYLYVNVEGVVVPFVDLPRFMGQVVYPNSMFEKQKVKFKTMEAVRLASVLLSVGVPPPALLPAFNRARAYVAGLLEGLEDGPEIRKYFVDNPAAGLGDAIHDAIASADGLRSALLRDWTYIWCGPALLPSRSELLALDVIDFRPAREPTLPEEPTHPATMANLGRPPPTVVWGPDKPKKVHVETIRERHRNMVRASHPSVYHTWGVDAESVFDEAELMEEYLDLDGVEWDDYSEGEYERLINEVDG